ncbi:LegC family aminotransferase [Dyadobacter bucti]|uniref:LegC family aminotransferase n=1 Tax=Dyadobacter bucti TaxID=2572203 RepID=UPI001108F5C4|nr:LegC family aminotransferase [Dyadobacter bucti]
MKSKERNEKIVTFIKDQFPGKEFIPLHVPYFGGNEKKYVLDTIDSTFVSSIGAYVDKFEELICQITGCRHAVAIVNGTNAIHLAMIVCGTKPNDEVLTQALTFIATCNAISYTGAKPVFIDVDKDTMGMSPSALSNFLEKNAEKRSDGFTYNKNTGRRISTCLPMHTFGVPLRIDKIAAICSSWNIVLVEDSAESLGSTFNGKHTGTIGKAGAFSFNGNKTVTCGGGGALITNDSELAKKAKHLSTQAKVAHQWEFYHNETGYNYRMPNLNAALACAQLEQLPFFLKNKRELAHRYQAFFAQMGMPTHREMQGSEANYWLNAVILDDLEGRNEFLEFTNANGVMTRPIWQLMNRLPMFNDCEHDGLENSQWLADRVVNIPSSFRP